ncbi:hypothetical protein LR48_Vigan230s000600 [Vigna angularis]|uniref:Uncharacterized protein n=1 Tax=Phaseolus angularis TaxID=3914 RepID=A0A0L9T676_PHAAN|nr:hypothetical protein LR48_Vigan230s000600 [Vigna angularis]
MQERKAGKNNRGEARKKRKVGKHKGKGRGRAESVKGRTKKLKGKEERLRVQKTYPEAEGTQGEARWRTRTPSKAHGDRGSSQIQTLKIERERESKRESAQTEMSTDAEERSICSQIFHCSHSFGRCHRLMSQSRSF